MGGRSDVRPIISSTSPPRLIKSATPAYTEEAVEAKVEGIVMLAFIVETDGKPSEIRVVRGLGKSTSGLRKRG